MGLRESVTVLEAVGRYAESIKDKESQKDAQRELFRFVSWCGPETILPGLGAPEVGNYADSIAGTGTTPLAAERLQVVRDFLSYAKRKGLIDTNLAQHVRVRKAKTRARSNQLREAPPSTTLTPEGHAELEAQLEKLKAERGPIAVQIRQAAADKDVRENVPLEAVREQLGLVESRIRYIESTLEFATVVDPSTAGPASVVGLGKRVSVRDLKTGRETRYTVVSASESNPLEGKISDVSPLGKALMGRAVGQDAEVETPRGKVRYRLLKISP